jgi:putative oxidoreductase
MVAGIVLILRAVDGMSRPVPIGVTALHAIAISMALLLLIGLWTPVAGILLGLIESCSIFWRLDNPWISILLATMALALALLGPGSWSLDARLYGWKVVNLPPPKGKSEPQE